LWELVQVYTLHYNSNHAVVATKKAAAEKSRWRWRFLPANPLGRWLAADDGNVGGVDQDGPLSATAKSMIGISERGMTMPEQASIVSGNDGVLVPSPVDIEKRHGESAIVRERGDGRRESNSIVDE